MASRSPEDFANERDALYQAFAQNEVGRDTFVGLAHTALFASSVSFVGDVRPLAEAIWKPILIVGWACNLIGLIALALSFAVVRRHIVARITALNSDEAPNSAWAGAPNAISLWCVPASLLCLFLFVTANVWNIDEPKAKPASTAVTKIPSGYRAARLDAAAALAELPTPGTRDSGRSHAGPSRAHPDAGTTPAASAAQQEVAPQRKGDR